MLALLQRSPLSYRVDRQRGSHRKLISGNGYPPLLFSFHDGQEINPRVVRSILTKDVGLTEAGAREIVEG